LPAAPDLRRLAGWQAVALTHLLWRGTAMRGAAAGAAERMAALDAACWRVSRREAIVGAGCLGLRAEGLCMRMC